MNLKILFFPIILLLAGWADPVCVPVTFNASSIPCMEVSIGRQTYSLEIDLGSKFQIILDKAVLAHIDKIPYGVTQWMGLKGGQYNAPMFLIPKVRIGALSFVDVLAQQQSDAFTSHATLWEDASDTNDKKTGTVGRQLLKRKNLLLDFPNSRIVLLDRATKIQEAEFFPKEAIRIPFNLSSVGIIVNIDTDVGEKRFLLDTGSTVTLIRALTPQDQSYETDATGLSYFTSSKFIIGDKDFGAKQLYLVDLTPKMHEIDGLLGMDFLRKHAVYIDFRAKALYVQELIRKL